MARQHKLLNLGSVRIHAVEEGEGPLVIMIHGFPESWHSWRNQLTPLAQAGYRAVAIDQRGYGRSSKFCAHDQYTISRLVDDIERVIDHYGEKQAVVIGHDWGAPVAWTFAWTRPEKCRAVIGMSVPFAGRALIGLPGNPFGDIPPLEYHATLAGPGKLFYQDYFGARDAIISEIEEDVRGWLKGITWTVGGECMTAAVAAGAVPADPIEAIRNGPLCVAEGAQMKAAFAMPETMPEWFTDKDLDFLAGEFERGGFTGPLSFYYNVENGWRELTSQAGKPLTPPALFIGGELDVGTIWGLETLENPEKRIPKLRGSHILPGSGHWLQQERPEECNRLILEFLKGENI